MSLPSPRGKLQVGLRLSTIVEKEIPFGCAEANDVISREGSSISNQGVSMLDAGARIPAGLVLSQTHAAKVTLRPSLQWATEETSSLGAY
jgi:hypothetical protein